MIVKDEQKDVFLEVICGTLFKVCIWQKRTFCYLEMLIKTRLKEELFC